LVDKAEATPASLFPGIWDGTLGSGVPGDVLAFYGRWWQFETWLREVVYVELRAKHGPRWTRHLQGRGPRRAAGDQVNHYMASADAGELLAYADVSDLFRLIEDQWLLFEPLLPPLRRWQGTTDELHQLRNRNAHCRRPHRDDVTRIEQVLRDLEAGALRFYTSYLNTQPLRGNANDPLAYAWVAGRHPTAARLLGHADRQYDVRFRLGYSVRPWASAPEASRVSGSEGVLWHATWTIGAQEVLPAELWQTLGRLRSTPELLLHLLLDMSSVTATFSALDDSGAVADAIGHIFDGILITARPMRLDEETEHYLRRWRRGAALLPRRVQIDTPLTLVDPFQSGALSIFGAD
jgi:hypothetical protein